MIRLKKENNEARKRYEEIDTPKAGSIERIDKDTTRNDW